jgi:hypothetical protein
MKKPEFVVKSLILLILMAPLFLQQGIYAHNLSSNDIIAYDPIEKKFIYKNKIDDIDGSVSLLLKDAKIKRFKDKKTQEFYIDENQAKNIIIVKRKNKDIEKYKKAEITTKRLKENIYRLELSDKQDGYWYRLKLKIPDGYTVRKILRDDGIAIRNNIQIDRKIGKIVVEEINWYVENNTLYFYDDPISGYSVVLSPPQPYFSIMVEEALNGAGQLSAIIYPYNGEQDLINGVDNRDHLGRNGDNNIGVNIDADAGSKIALRYQVGANPPVQYGNQGTNYTTSVDGNLVHNSTSYEYLNITPWEETEAVITTTFQTPAGAPANFIVTKKTIIRGNKKWFATLYYIQNTSAVSPYNFRFFQGCDWNFNGNFDGDSCAYDSTYDTVFGYKLAGNPVSYGGFSGMLASANHHVGDMPSTWQAIVGANLNNQNAYSGDAGVALEWNLGAFAQNEKKVVEIVWGYGNTLNAQGQVDMQNEINYGKQRMRDVGIMNILNPANDSKFQNSDSYVMITATTVNYGLRDWDDLPVHIKIEGPIGFTPVDITFTSVNLSVPSAESVIVGYNFNISSVPAGLYTVTVYTDLDNDKGITDQNQTNDYKIVTFYVGGVSINPQINTSGNLGSFVNSYLTITNTSGYNDRFDIELLEITKNWPAYLINISDGVTIAADINNDGIWDYVNAAYDTNLNNKPDILVNNGNGFNFIFRKYIPDTEESGALDTTKIKITGVNYSNLNASNYVYIRSNYKTAVNKTLWLHGSIQSPATHQYSLTTLTDTAAAGTYTEIPRYASRVWSLSPVLYRDLRIVNNTIPVNLMLNRQTGPGTDFIDTTVILFYTNGINNYQIGKAVIRVNANQMFTFNIPVVSTVIVPAGYKLALLVNNGGNNNRWIRVFHSSSTAPDERSNISLQVTDYVGIDWINVYDIAGNTNPVIAAGTLAHIATQISDPFGSYDINTANARITIIDASGTTVVNNSALVYEDVDTGNPSGWKRMFYNYNIPLAGPEGEWKVIITAVEGNGATNSRIGKFMVKTPDHIRILPLYSEIPSGNNVNLSVQAVDISGNSIAIATWVTITANNNAVFNSVPSGWGGNGTNTIYGLLNSYGFASISVTDTIPESVTITPDSNLIGSKAIPDRDEKAFIYFTPPHHAIAIATDGIAVAGASGTGESVRIWIADINGNTIAFSRWVTVTASASGYWTSAPAGWTIAGNLAYGPTNANGYADLIVKDNNTETITITPDSSPWGNHSYDVSCNVVFVAPGADHVVLADPDGGTLTAGAQKTLNIKVVDADGLTVSGNYNISISAPEKATFTATTLTGASGIGTGYLTGTTDANGQGTITIINYYAQGLTVTPDSSLQGSLATPDRDVPVYLVWLPGQADHIRAKTTVEYTNIGATVLINLQIVDLYGNSVASSQYINVTVSGAAIFTATTLSGATGLNTNSVFGTTNSNGFATITLYNETAQTNTVTPHSTILPGSTASPDRDEITIVTFTSNLPTPTATATYTVTLTRTPTFTITPSVTSTYTVTPTVTETVTPSVTPTVTETVTPTVTPTITPTITETVTPSVTQTVTPTVTETVTPTVTETVTPTVTETVTPTVTETVTPTVTQTVTPTITETVTPTVTETVTETVTPTVTETVTPTVTETVTQTITPTVTSTNTPSVTSTNTPTVTPTVTETVTPSVTPTVTETVTPTVTETVTPTVTETVTPTVTETVTRTVTPTNTSSVTQTVTPTVTETVTPTVTETVTPTVTPTATDTATPTFTVTDTSTFTVTDTPTYTVKNTATDTATPTFTVTETPTFTLTNTLTYTVTDTATDTATPTFTMTDTPTFTVTDTPTYTVTDTATDTATPTFTVTDTPTFTVTDTPTYTVTNTATDTATPTFTVTDTPTFTVTDTPTYTVTDTATDTATPTFTVTDTSTFTVTDTPTYTVTDTATDTATPTFTVTDTSTFTVTDTPTFTVTDTPTFTVTDTPTYTITDTSTFTVTETPSPTDTNTTTATSSSTPTFTETDTAIYTNTPTLTVTETPTYTVTETYTETVSETPTQTYTISPTSTYTETESASHTQSPTFTETSSETPAFTYSVTQTYSTTETNTDTPTITQTFTYTPTFTFTDTTTLTFTPTYSLTLTATPSITLTRTVTNTFAPTLTFTITPTFTISPTPSGENRIEITIYDSSGFEVIKLPSAQSQIIIHNFTFSQNPFRTNGTNILYIRNDVGQTIGSWDGKNKYGDMAKIGTYIVEVKTFDKNNNEYVVQKTLDLIVDLSSDVGIKVYYADTNIKISGIAKNINWIKIKIYNIAGELIKILDPVISGDNIEIIWDKKTTSGNNASTGIYIITMEYKDKDTGIISRKFEKLAIK